MDNLAIAFRDLAEANRRSLHKTEIVKAALLDVPHRSMWRPDDALAVAAAGDLVALLDTYDAEAFREHAGYVHPDNTRKYLQMTALRVAHLMDALRAKGLPRGSSVLEVGALFGSFAVPLARAGYRVTAADRYGSFSGALDAYIGLLDRTGVRVAHTTAEAEDAEIDALGVFDCVIAMAVIEHVPHTPRLFLESLKRSTRNGGVLALDTPNLARYWNRKRLAAGESIFQPLEMQFESTPPWEGHHREYTPLEMLWMMERIGCEDIELRMLDYNMLQYETIDRQHIDCLAACIEDPMVADVILTCGRVARR